MNLPPSIQALLKSGLSSTARDYMGNKPASLMRVQLVGQEKPSPLEMARRAKAAANGGNKEKVETAAEEPVKRGRGRPRKHALPAQDQDEDLRDRSAKRKRGCPRKAQNLSDVLPADGNRAARPPLLAVSQNEKTPQTSFSPMLEGYKLPTSPLEQHEEAKQSAQKPAATVEVTARKTRRKRKSEADKLRELDAQQQPPSKRSKRAQPRKREVRDTDDELEVEETVEDPVTPAQPDEENKEEEESEVEAEDMSPNVRQAAESAEVALQADIAQQSRSQTLDHSQQPQPKNKRKRKNELDKLKELEARLNS